MKKQKDSLSNMTKRVLAILLAGILMIDPGACSILTAHAAESLSVEELSEPAEAEGQGPESLEDLDTLESEEQEPETLEDGDGPEEVVIDELSFPDENLREIIAGMVDTDQDGVLTEEERSAVLRLDISHSGITTLKGLEYFEQLKELDCSWNYLTKEEVKPYLELENIQYFNNTYLAETSEEEIEETMEVEPEEEDSAEAGEQEAGGQEAGEQEAGGQEAGEQGADEQEASEQESDQQESDQQESVSQGADSQDAVSQGGDGRAADGVNLDIQPIDAQVQEENVGGDSGTENQFTENQPTEGQYIENQLTENQPTEDQYIENQLTKDNPAEIQPAEDQFSGDASGQQTSEGQLPGDTSWQQAPEDQPSGDTSWQQAPEDQNPGDGSQQQDSEEEQLPQQEQRKPWKFTFISVVSAENLPEEVPLDEINFPDEAFRSFLAENYDKNEDLILSQEELGFVTSLYVKDSQIQDLTGISFFKNLLLLECSVNQLTELHTEELLELRGLYCKENQIQTLDLTNNTQLKQLECDENVEVIGWVDPSLRDQEENTGDPSLESDTKKISVGRAKIKKLSNPKKEILRMTYGKVSGAKGYDVQIATAKNFKSGLRRVFTTKLTQDFDRMYKGKTYYARVRAYKLDSSNKRVFGAFSPIKSIKITSGRISVNPSANAATLRSVSLVSSKTVRIQASAPNYVKSVDGYYYLFNLTLPESKLPAGRKPIAKKAKRTNIVFNVSLYNGTKHNRLTRQFAIGVKTSKTSNQYQLITGAKFISNPEKLAVSNRAFPKSSTKKGLQVNEFYISDAVKLGIKHTTYNMCLDDMIATDSEKNNARGIPFSYNGKTYWFDRGVIESYDRTLNTYKKNNMIVSAIILLRYRGDLTYLTPNGLYQSGFYALNTTTSAARSQLAATFTFLAQRYATDGRISNWIIGNEVNNYGTYHYTGSHSLSRNAKIYTNAFRLAYISIRSVYSKARLYISLDHLWNTITANGHGSKQFLNAFAKYWNSYGTFNIAYHPYPSPLTAPEFWRNTNGAISNSYNSACVNMGNLNVLTNYVKKKFGSGTRIILSEQGFTSRKAGVNVEKNQAAAIAYAYYLAEFNDMIDAFILHRHVDHQVEINQGLALGLWTNKAGTIETMGTKKYAWDVYKYVDTPQGAKKTAFALPIIGKGSWKMAVPGYNASRFS